LKCYIFKLIIHYSILVEFPLISRIYIAPTNGSTRTKRQRLGHAKKLTKARSRRESKKLKKSTSKSTSKSTRKHYEIITIDTLISPIDEFSELLLKELLLLGPD